MKYTGAFGLISSHSKAVSSAVVPPVFIVKYVDDLLAVMKRGTEDVFCCSLSSFHQDTQFTIEKSNNDIIPFLDVKFRIVNNQIETRWWQKPYSSSWVLSFLTAHPLPQRVGVDIGIAHRILTVAHKHDLRNAIKTIFYILERKK